MKIASPGRAETSSIDEFRPSANVATSWRDVQADAVRRFRSRTRAAASASTLELLAVDMADFKFIGTQAGRDLLADCIVDLNRLLPGDGETRATLALVLDDEIARDHYLRQRLDGETVK